MSAHVDIIEAHKYLFEGNALLDIIKEHVCPSYGKLAGKDTSIHFVVVALMRKLTKRGVYDIHRMPRPYPRPNQSKRGQRYLCPALYCIRVVVGL